jgi:hypothetical protein
MRESCIETRLNNGMERCGGLCEKFKSPGRRNVPDRLVTWPDGEMELVELKAPGKKPRTGQLRDHQRRAKCNVKVHVISTVEGVDKFLRRGNPSAQYSEKS